MGILGSDMVRLRSFHHEGHEGHEEECRGELRALRVLRGEFRSFHHEGHEGGSVRFACVVVRYSVLDTCKT